MTSDDASFRAYGLPPPGFRLPKGLKLGRVRFQVSDLSRSVDYYERVIGLRAVARGRTTAELAPAEAPASTSPPLLELVERPGARPVPRRGRLGLFHVAILLPDRASLGRFLAHLGDLGVRPGMSDHFVSEALYLYDPDGLGLEVYADRPRDAWRLDGRQVHMTSEPLDIPGVLAAGEGRQWTGAPAATVVGHVHLSVDDLDRAAGFYHAGLGLDKMAWDYPGALFMAADGYHHHLGTNVWSAGAPVAGEDDARLLEWEIVLPSATDVDQARASLAAQGADVSATANGIRVTDPWNVGVVVRGKS